MSNLPKSLKKQADNYAQLTDEQKYKFLDKLYNQKLFSVPLIAQVCGTYNNRIRRDMLKLGLEIRDKSAAQRIALDNNRSIHPTEGKQRSDKTKLKISEAMESTWNSLSDEEKRRRSQIGKEQWEAKTDAEKEELRSKAFEGVRLAAKHGSKLEKILFDRLVKSDYIVDFHKERLIKNAKLQIDIFETTLGVAIEIDGPSHFSDIWGDRALQRNMQADAEKDGLLLGSGFYIIRIRQTKSLTKAYIERIWGDLSNTLEKIKQGKQRTKRIVLEEQNDDS